MKIIKSFIFILTLMSFSYSNSIAEEAEAEPTTFKNTIHAMQLCETGSSLTNCVNPATIGSSTDGTTMDLSVRGSANSFGNAGLIPVGITYTHGQVILSRSFTMKGTVTTSAATCKTGGSDGTKTAGGATGNAGAVAEQVIMATNGTNYPTTMNSTSAIINGTDADPGTIASADDLMKFRWKLSKPFKVTVGQIPTMTMTFDLSGALTFNDGSGDGECDGNDFHPGSPVITNTFE